MIRARVRFVLLALALLPLAACDDEPAEEAGSWSVVFEELPGALLSVYGTASDDVWVVGADADDGAGPAVLHYDGEGWTRMATGASGSLWWVTGRGDTLWMVGEGGLILRHVRGSGTFEQMTPPDTAPTLFGVLAFADDDVWAVGGEAVGNRGAVWHYDGTAWAAAADVPEEALAEGQLFKLWGRGADDFYIVGLGGIALHRSGGAFATLDVPTGRGLFTIHGDGDLAFAVGGFQSGLVLRLQGGAFTEVTPPGAPQLNGVFVTPEGEAVAVGLAGAVWRWSKGAWKADEKAPRLRVDLHAAYQDETGGVFAVGGFVVSEPLNRGVLVHYGAAIADAVQSP
ncbi:MAG: hypothetical protein KC620_00820 [Myxococcales bacterium]|nr:hypothetical protein [Myxococcales bacterium]